MAATDLVFIAPLLGLAVSIVAITLFIAFRRSNGWACLLSLAGIFSAFAALFAVPADTVHPQVTLLLVMDRYALFYQGLILAGAFAVAVLSCSYLRTHSERPEEYYVLLLVSTLGAMVLASSSHFASFFLGLEILSIPLYVLIAYPLNRSAHIEAGLKYLVLSAVAVSFLVFGMALVYARLGTMEFAGMAVLMMQHPSDPLVLAGLAMVVIGAGFKLAFVPFHLWTPDVYQGAPAPVTAFLATVSKGAVFAVLLRIFAGIRIPEQGPLFLVLAAISVLSMSAGNLLALLQRSVKRLLAYSSIAHFGYLLVAFLSSGPLRVIAVTYYLAAYFITTIGAFGTVALLSGGSGEADDLEDYAGLYFRKPWLALAFTLMLLSLAGIPLTVGFIGKVYLLTAGIGSSLWLLVALLVINSVIGIYYYLRVITVMFLEPAEEQADPEKLSRAGSLVMWVLVILLVWWGLYPAPVIALIETIP